MLAKTSRPVTVRDRHASSFPPPIASPILPLKHTSTEVPKSPFATTTQPTQATMLPYFGGGLSRAWRWNA